MRTILFQETIKNSVFGNFVSFNKGVMIHRQIENRAGFVFMRMKKRRLID